MSDAPVRSSGTADTSLVNDPEFPWRASGGERPYDVLNVRLKASEEPLLGPHSSTAEVSDASFTLIGMSAAERKAWDGLRKPAERVVVDFFHYPLPDLRLEGVDPAALERPMPVEQPDLLGLADCKVELATEAAPERLEFHEVPVSELIDFGIAELLPSRLCDAAPQLADVFEVEE